MLREKRRQGEIQRQIQKRRPNQEDRYRDRDRDTAKERDTERDRGRESSTGTQDRQMYSEHVSKLPTATDERSNLTLLAGSVISFLVGW